jgi:hypothetical protein
MLGGYETLYYKALLTLKSTSTAFGRRHGRIASQINCWCTLLDDAIRRSEGGRRQRKQRDNRRRAQHFEDDFDLNVSLSILCLSMNYARLLLTKLTSIISPLDLGKAWATYKSSANTSYP